MVLSTFFSSLVSVAMMLASNPSEHATEVFPHSLPTDSELNTRPIIGLMAQAPAFACEEENYGSYIAASYVKFLESAGARVVPIKYTDSLDAIKEQMDHINGVLFPGGDTPLLKSLAGDFKDEYPFERTYAEDYTRYMNIVQFILDIAMEKNDKGIHFPVLAICLGFESLGLAFKQTKTLDFCDSHGMASGQKIVNSDQSRWFRDLTPSDMEVLEQQSLIYESHYNCFIKENWDQDQDLDDFFLITSTAEDHEGVTYVNSIEARKYPFFGFQYHPEKAAYEWPTANPIPHQLNARYWSQLLADRFGHQIRHSHQKFESSEEEHQALIYNTNPLFAGNEYIMQVYCFDHHEQQDLKRAKDFQEKR